MKINIKTNYKGYFTILRAIQLLLKDKKLTFAQMGFYICFVSQADFDRRHALYRVITRDDIELAKEWGCNSTTVYRQRKDLISKGLLTEENGLTKVTDFYMFELEWAKIFAKLPLLTLQELFTKPNEEVAKQEFFVAEMQKKQTQKDAQSSNVSSKGELGLSKNDEDISRYFDENEIVEDVSASNESINGEGGD